MVTLDVKALYPSIPQDEGRLAVLKALKKPRPKPDIKPSNQSICDLLKHVLEKNNFIFNGGMYRQIKGTAMGTKCAPAFANIFMSDFEEQHVYTHPVQPLVWFRFIDDIFAVFTCTREEVEQFIYDIDHANPSIRFTANISQTSVDFLDTTVKVDEHGKLFTTLYTKPTDTHDYLLYNSAHPKHCKDATPFSQLLRVCKICTLDTDFVKNSEMVLSNFYRRGYPIEVLKSAWNAVKILDRDDLLIEKPQQSNAEPTEQSFYLTTTYNPSAPNLKGLIGKNWDLVNLPPHDQNIDLKQVKKGYRRCPNLRDKLVKSTIEWPEPDAPEARTHWDPDRVPTDCPEGDECTVCPLIKRSGRIASHQTLRTYHAPIGVNCESDNLIYLITCKRCHAQYVGETYRTLGKRMKEHLRSIRNKNHNLVVGDHIGD